MNPDSEAAADPDPAAITGDGPARDPHAANPPSDASTHIRGRTPSSLRRRSGRRVPAFRLPHTFSSLSNRDFRLLWLGTMFWIASHQMQAIAQGYLVYEMTGSAKVLGLVSASAAVPLLGLALVGGAIADRVNRKRIIQAGQIVGIFLGLFIAIAIVTETITWVHFVGVGMVLGAIWSTLVPARHAMLPHLVEREQLGNAVALIAAGMGAASLLAPAIAGVLYASIGPAGVYFTVAGMSTIAVILTTSISEGSKATPDARRPLSEMFSEIKDGLRYLWHSQMIKLLMAIGFVFVFLSAPLQALLPVLILDVYHRETGALGLLVSGMGMGGLVGALVIASWGERRRGLLIIGAAFLSGGALVALAAVPIYLAAVPILVVFGLGNGLQWSLNQVLIMSRIEDGYRGRVMSIYMMNFGLMPLAVLPAGVAMDRYGSQYVVGAIGLALVVAATAVLLTQPKVRQLQ